MIIVQERIYWQWWVSVDDRVGGDNLSVYAHENNRHLRIRNVPFASLVPSSFGYRKFMHGIYMTKNKIRFFFAVFEEWALLSWSEVVDVVSGLNWNGRRKLLYEHYPKSQVIRGITRHQRHSEAIHCWDIDSTLMTQCSLSFSLNSIASG